jgi:hypothetical protein
VRAQPEALVIAVYAASAASLFIFACVVSCLLFCNTSYKAITSSLLSKYALKGRKGAKTDDAACDSFDESKTDLAVEVACTPGVEIVVDGGTDSSPPESVAAELTDRIAEVERDAEPCAQRCSTVDCDADKITPPSSIRPTDVASRTSAKGDFVPLEPVDIKPEATTYDLEPAIVALETFGNAASVLRTSFKGRASHRKLQVDESHRDDYAEEKNSTRHIVASPGRAFKSAAPTSTHQPSDVGATLSSRRRMQASERKSREVEPSNRRRPCCMAEIFNSSSNLEGSEERVAEPPGTRPEAPAPTAQSRSSMRWMKPRHNHRNERIAQQRIPSVVEQWWTEPPGVGQILYDLRRSLTKTRI